MKKPAWSHSSLKDFEGCQRRYHEVKVLKNYPFQETEATRYGNQVHEALELYVKDGKPLPPEFSQFQGIADALIKKPGRKLAEYQMALSADLKPVEWFDKEVWVRGIADLLILDDDNFTAWVVDYKTGNDKYPDRDQLVLMSIMVFEHFPHIRKVNSALMFIVKNSMVKMQMTRDAKDAAWWKYRERTARIEQCYETGVWNPTQTPLCKWCQVTGCEFNPKH
jgi:PD-(D/E)XK nuclease superfamily